MRMDGNDDSKHKSLQAGLSASSSGSSSSRTATGATLSNEERDKILAMLDDEPEVNVRG